MSAEGESGNWKHKALAAVGVGIGVLFSVGLGLYSYLMATATPLHPDPRQIASVTHTSPPPKWTSAVERARQVARAGLAEQNLPGLSVAVGAGSDVVWAEGFGWADIDKRAPVAPHLRFRIGHASNALTSAAVGLLVEKRRLRLDDEIQTYVPAFPRKQWPVTLRQLMAHVAGVRHYQGEGDYMPSAHCERASDGLARFADDPLKFQPDTRYAYSTFGWILVSAAVEAAAGEPFLRFMDEQIFEPLGMRDTTSESTREPVPDLVTFYYPRFSGDTTYGPELATEVDYSCFAGAGAFLSTPTDLARFGLAMNSGKLLKPETVAMLQTPHLLASGEDTGNGLGWTLETVPLAGQPARMASHASRTLLGGSTSFMTFPERGLVVAMTTNISLAKTREMALRIAEIFADGSAGPEMK